MNEIAVLLDRMQELEPQMHVYGPASDVAIQQLEASFGRPMPPSYRAFLARFGAFHIVNWCYSGIIADQTNEGRGWAWTDTLVAREYCRLPEHYLVVQPDEDGFTCLDFSRVGSDGEHPVIYHRPFRETPFNELGSSYKAWLVEDLQAMIEAWDDGAELEVSPDSE